MLKDILRDTPAYQRILEEGREEGIEEGRERGIEEGIERGIEQGIERGIEQGRQEALLRQRKALLNLLLDRFPRIVRRTKRYIDAIDDAEILLRVIIKMATIQTAEEAEQFLAAVADDDEETD